MFNLFKKQQTVTETIEQIHNEFNHAGEKLLHEAKEILKGIQLGNVERVELLKRHGFNNTVEVDKHDTAMNIKQKKESLATALYELSVAYPIYKFITPDEALKICEKYNLVIGEVSRYKGFVPHKNLLQIDKFFEKENELNVIYTKSDSFSSNQMISKQDYEIGKSRERQMSEYYSRSSNIGLSGLAGHYREWYNTGRTTLEICAPLKDMDRKNSKLIGRMLKTEIPDPVVLAPFNYKGINLKCIVTAWGDEASDEIVVNEINN